ncbi:hypothetical protein RB594_001901 [Gaeumannomyces avenae]
MLFPRALALLPATASVLVEAECHSRCEAFGDTLSIPNVSFVSSTHYSNGGNITLDGVVQSCAWGGGVEIRWTEATSDLCRIVVNVTTSPTSEVLVEAWLPDTWTGRFLATGTGGLGGCVDYYALQNGVSSGFATLGTNAGHNGSAGSDFFLNQPETINDFGHRAIHVEAEVGKELLAQYYGSAPRHSYYAGCSTGGRQGFMNALMYPSDFDGVVAGAAAVSWLNIVASKAVLAQRLGWPNLSDERYVPPSSWRAIEAAMVEHLDPLDGVTDGVIDNPHAQSFNFSLLQCGPDSLLDQNTCLTGAQAAAVAHVYEPVVSPASGLEVLPGFDLGANTNVFSANQSPRPGAAGLAYRVLDDYWRGAVYNTSAWDSRDFNLTQMDFAAHVNPGRVNFGGGPYEGSHDLSAYKARGGRLLAYHGRMDETVTSAIATRTFDGVADATGSSAEEMLDFYRLFAIPGHSHCTGGTGAWAMGQPTAKQGYLSFAGTGRFADAEHSILMAMVRWVEDGVAPAWLVGTKFAGNDLANGKVLAQRKHCAWPALSRWDGIGDSNKAESWRCETPDQ